MKIAIVYGNDGSDVRIAKTCATLVKLGHEVHFIGWDRRPDQVKESVLPGVYCHVVPHAVPVLGTTWGGQWAFARHAVKTLLRLRPDVVTAVNEDNVARIGWLKGIAFRKLVCDVFDSHLDRMTRHPRPVQAVEYAVWNTARWWCDRLIATDELRFETFGRFREKTTVVGNYPPDPGVELSRRLPSGPPRLFVSGTLSAIRGLQQTLRAAEQVPGMRIVVAGWAGDEYAANEFLPHPAVEYLGHLTPRESLVRAAECDALLAMYAPTTRNQILASPNKIYDALSVGRPVIINAEARVSNWVVQQGVGFACPYDDVAALAEYFSTLLERRACLPEFAAGARTLFESGYRWEAMEDRLQQLYEGLDDAASNLLPRRDQRIQSYRQQRAA